MEKKKRKHTLIKKFQKEILFWDIESDSDDKKNRICNDFGTRSCLTCGKCWEKEVLKLKIRVYRLYNK